ncbi:hypothetical protein D3C77_608110 [compost metagenome]
MSAGIPGGGGPHAGLLPETSFHAPETAECKNRLLQAGGKRWLQRMTVHVVAGRDRNRRVASGQGLFGTGECGVVGGNRGMHGERLPR